MIEGAYSIYDGDMLGNGHLGGNIEFFPLYNTFLMLDGPFEFAIINTNNLCNRRKYQAKNLSAEERSDDLQQEELRLASYSHNSKQSRSNKKQKN